MISLETGRWPRFARVGAVAWSAIAVAVLPAGAVVAAGTAMVVSAAPAAAKTPGKTYCFVGRCHRVKTLEETRRAVGKRMVVKASFYDDARKDRFNPSNITSSGEYYRADRPDNAASPIWPDGTLLLVWSPASKRSVVVRINNAGPYWGGRTLDLSRAAAARLGFAHVGVATLHTKVLAAPSRAEATYRRGRTYPPAPGFIGVFQSIEMALAQAGKAVGGLLAAPSKAAGEATVAAADAPISARRTATDTASAARIAVKAARVAEKREARAKLVRADAGVLTTAQRRGTQRRAKAASEGKIASVRPKSAHARQERLKRQVPVVRQTARQVVIARVVEDEEVRPRNSATRQRSPANRAVAAARRAAVVSQPRVQAASRTQPRASSQFKPTQCQGWPSFCGREEG